MIRVREDGACYAYSRADGTAYVLRRDQYAGLLAAWMAGAAFWTGVTVYGSHVTLKLGDIVAVIDSSAANLRCGREDGTADEREDAFVV